MKTHTVAPEAAPAEWLEKHKKGGAARGAAAAAVTVVVLGGTHDAGAGGLRLASRGMRIVGLRGRDGRSGVGGSERGCSVPVDKLKPVAVLLFEFN